MNPTRTIGLLAVAIAVVTAVTTSAVSAEEYAPDTAPIAETHTLSTEIELTGETHTLSPCEYEDSSNCYWNGAEQGNGIGASFVNIGGTLYYLQEGTS